MSWTKDRVLLEGEARRFDSSITLHTKDGWFMKICATLLLLVTFGKMKQERFQENFATTIGPRLYFPRSWTTSQVEWTLPHEARHVKQARWCGAGIHPWVGLPIFGILYLFIILPIGGAIFRAWAERDALKTELQYKLSKGVWVPSQALQRATDFGKTVCSSSYAWSIPARWGVPWFEEAATQVIIEEIQPQDKE